jgi:TolB protein
MKHVLILFLSLTQLAWADIYITVSGANVKRAKIAIGQVFPQGDAQNVDAKLASDVREQVRSDLNFVNLFDFLSESLFVSLDKASDLSSIHYEDWATLSTAFVLKMGYKINAGKLLIEASLFDVPGQKKIFQRRYQYAQAQYPRLVHALSEDIMKELTGERGLFFSRILMVCRDLKPKRSNSKEVYIADADGSNLTQLTYDKTLTLSPAWSPDSKAIVYTQYETRAYGKVVKRGTVLKKHYLQTGERKVISAREGMNSGAAWSPKGDKVALTLSFTGHPEIYLMNPSGAGDPEPFSRFIQMKKLSGEGYQPLNMNLLFDVEPKWSPDGNKMVFSSARSGHPMIYTVDVASKVSTQLTFAGVYNATPDWSPKGDKIIFSAQRSGEGNFDLYMIDPDGNNLSRVTNGERFGRRRVNSENASWAPTGRHLALASSETGNYAVYIMTLDGAVKRKISPENKECTEPAWGHPEG